MSGAMYMEADLTLQKNETAVIMKIIQKVNIGRRRMLTRAGAFIGNREDPRVQMEWKKPLKIVKNTKN